MPMFEKISKRDSIFTVVTPTLDVDKHKDEVSVEVATLKSKNYLIVSVSDMQIMPSAGGPVCVTHINYREVLNS